MTEKPVAPGGPQACPEGGVKPWPLIDEGEIVVLGQTEEGTGYENLADAVAHRMCIACVCSRHPR